jgi:hypothetical protein
MNPRTLRTVRADQRPAPRVDELSANVVTEAVDELAKLRTPFWLGDTAVHLHALASLITQAERPSPKPSTPHLSKNPPGPRSVNSSTSRPTRPPSDTGTHK